MSKVISYLFYSPEGATNLEKLGTVVSFPQNTILAKAGKSTEYCYIVKEGCVVSYDYYDGKRQRIFHLYEKNSLFLEANVLFDKPSTVWFKTTCKTKLICIHKRSLMKAVQTDPQFALSLIEAASDKMNAALEQLKCEKKHDAIWKICDMFRGFARHYGVNYENSVLVERKISQQMIAELLGINRVTVAREIKKLKDMELIDQVNGFYCIKDMERLEEYIHG